MEFEGSEFEKDGYFKSSLLNILDDIHIALEAIASALEEITRGE